MLGIFMCVQWVLHQPRYLLSPFFSFLNTQRLFIAEQLAIPLLGGFMHRERRHWVKRSDILVMAPWVPSP